MGPLRPTRPPANTMSAAPLATAVPLPIATPMSARASAGASFTPSPVIATTWPWGQRKEESERGHGVLIHRRACIVAKPQQHSTQQNDEQHIAHMPSNSPGPSAAPQASVYASVQPGSSPPVEKPLQPAPQERRPGHQTPGLRDACVGLRGMGGAGVWNLQMHGE